MGARLGLWLATAILLVACGGETASRRPSPEADSVYPGRCELIAVEYAEVPRRAETEPEPGAVMLVASYRLGDEARPPYAVRFRVEQRSAEALRAHLEHHATVACNPERAGEPESLDLPPIEPETSPMTPP